jgi:hypothetical protein
MSIRKWNEVYNSIATAFIFFCPNAHTVRKLIYFSSRLMSHALSRLMGAVLFHLIYCMFSNGKRFVHEIILQISVYLIFRLRKIHKYPSRVLLFMEDILCLCRAYDPMKYPLSIKFNRNSFPRS